MEDNKIEELETLVDNTIDLCISSLLVREMCESRGGDPDFDEIYKKAMSFVGPTTFRTIVESALSTLIGIKSVIEKGNINEIDEVPFLVTIVQNTMTSISENRVSKLYDMFESEESNDD